MRDGSKFFGKTVGFRLDDVLYYQAFTYEGKPRVRIGIKKPAGLSFMSPGGETETLFVKDPEEARAVMGYLRNDLSITEAQLLEELKDA